MHDTVNSSLHDLNRVVRIVSHQHPTATDAAANVVPAAEHGACLQAIRSLPENDDYMSGPVPSQTVVARDHMLVHEPEDPNHQEDEDDAWRAVRVLRKKVYANAAPYLRVTDPNEVHESNDEIFSAKDNMRVHPRDEDSLSKIACAALDIADPVEAHEDPIPSAIGDPNKVGLFVSVPTRYLICYVPNACLSPDTEAPFSGRCDVSGSLHCEIACQHALC